MPTMDLKPSGLLRSKLLLRSNPFLRSLLDLRSGVWIAYKNSRLSMPDRLPSLSVSVLVITPSQILFKRQSLIAPAFSCSVEPSPKLSVEPPDF